MREIAESQQGLLQAFRDGDQMCVVLDDFINLQESPAIFLPLTDKWAQVMEEKGLEAVPTWIKMGLTLKLMREAGDA